MFSCVLQCYLMLYHRNWIIHPEYHHNGNITCLEPIRWELRSPRIHVSKDWRFVLSLQESDNLDFFLPWYIYTSPLKSHPINEYAILFSYGTCQQSKSIQMVWVCMHQWGCWKSGWHLGGCGEAARGQNTHSPVHLWLSRGGYLTVENKSKHRPFSLQ